MKLLWYIGVCIIYNDLNFVMCVTHFISTPTACTHILFMAYSNILVHRAGCHAVVCNRARKHILIYDNLNRISICLPTRTTTPSGSDASKTLINIMLPGLIVTDSSGKRTRSKSPASVPASLISKVNP